MASTPPRPHPRPYPPIPLTLLTSLLPTLSLSLLPTASAYSWTFQNTPQQCANLTLSIVGSDGTPPYEVLIIPFGPSPLANNVEARKIMQVPFGDGKTSVSFRMGYPGDSQFVAVVLDAAERRLAYCVLIRIRISFHAASIIHAHLIFISPASSSAVSAEAEAEAVSSTLRSVLINSKLGDDSLITLQVVSSAVLVASP
ncbi:hypothetical protein CVT26_010285 [Gymnopilus dilepis]|uniref:Uncharacterized protein n=1 Tax=Gymnopilus dilepis TaxID=231916 RepID=A0A409Y149_9AGAR|nr:hypothetical protein CVT26_010285 [Gymnopilus dilepis]